MKPLIAIILAATVFSIGQSQVAELLNDAKTDATYLSSGFQADCYTLKYGDVNLTGSAVKVTKEQAQAMLESDFEIVYAEGCEKAGEIEHMEVKFDYASGVSNTMPFESIDQIKELSLRLIHDLSKITIQNVRYTDAAGSIVSMEDTVITIE